MARRYGWNGQATLLRKSYIKAGVKPGDIVNVYSFDSGDYMGKAKVLDPSLMPEWPGVVMQILESHNWHNVGYVNSWSGFRLEVIS